MRSLGLLAPALLAGCAAEQPKVHGETPGYACHANGLDRFAGALVNADVARQIQLASGARVVRWLGPHDIVTMEYRADRVNLHLDETLHNIVRINCG